MQCGVCGSTGFVERNVLWDKLISDWQLSPQEAQYINAQQGRMCTTCGSNLRSIALANAIRSLLGTPLRLVDLPAQEACRHLAILEINEAGSLSPILRQFPGYTFGAYPEVDMHALPFPDGSFDLIVHSDTLEHVENPVHGLRECWRALKPQGALCFTVPVVTGRMSRNRAGLEKSYHKDKDVRPEDVVVHTEFGADVWTYVLQAGFQRVEFHATAYPAGLAIVARKA